MDLTFSGGGFAPAQDPRQSMEASSSLASSPRSDYGEEATDASVVRSQRISGPASPRSSPPTARAAGAVGLFSRPAAWRG
eukprot:SAG11_NODE_10056_length_860_cov_1.793693_1_plen_79_part_01